MKSLLGLALLLSLPACAGVEAPQDKGSEFAPLDGKVDSFFSPTNHGRLLFGLSNETAITEDQSFHAWEFELKGAAELSLSLSSTVPNLDTVLYLYHRLNLNDSWGPYIARNDDDGDSMLSKIEKAGVAGHYKVIAKGYKEHHRGAFSLKGECSGGGCPDQGNGGTVDLPRATEFSDGCVYSLWESLSSSIDSENEFSIHPEQTQGHDPAVLLATAHYDLLISDWRDYEDDPDDFLFDVEYQKLEDGARVIMGDGGDESTTDYIFDAEHNLLAYFVRNQSPWFEFYCEETGDVVAEPDEDCLSNWFRRAPQQDDDSSEGSLVWQPGAANSDLGPAMSLAVSTYQKDVLADDQSLAINISYTTWDDGRHMRSTLVLEAQGSEIVSYTTVDAHQYGRPWVVFSSSENGDGVEMLCIEG